MHLTLELWNSALSLKRIGWACVDVPAGPPLTGTDALMWPLLLRWAGLATLSLWTEQNRTKRTWFPSWVPSLSLPPRSLTPGKVSCPVLKWLCREAHLARPTATCNSHPTPVKQSGETTGPASSWMQPRDRLWASHLGKLHLRLMHRNWEIIMSVALSVLSFGTIFYATIDNGHSSHIATLNIKKPVAV